MSKHDLPDDWQDLRKYDDPKYDESFARLLHDLEHGPSHPPLEDEEPPKSKGCAQLVFVALVLLLFILSAFLCYVWFTAGGSVGGLV